MVSRHYAIKIGNTWNTSCKIDHPNDVTYSTGCEINYAIDSSILAFIVIHAYITLLKVAIIQFLLYGYTINSKHGRLILVYIRFHFNLRQNLIIIMAISVEK